MDHTKSALMVLSLLTGLASCGRGEVEIVYEAKGLSFADPSGTTRTCAEAGVSTRSFALSYPDSTVNPPRPEYAFGCASDYVLKSERRAVSVLIKGEIDFGTVATRACYEGIDTFSPGIGDRIVRTPFTLVAVQNFAQDPTCVGALCGAGALWCATGCSNPKTDTSNCGACGMKCPMGQICEAGVCKVGMATCMDMAKNGAETDVDCGGGTCPKCADGKACMAPADCAGGTCTGNRCTSSMMCTADAMACTSNAQCCSKACTPVANGRLCSGLAAACKNGMKDGGETDVDCGGDCAPCANGKVCLKHDDCDSDVCLDRDGVMSCTTPAATCSNNVKDGGESDVDCGGMLCPTCLSGKKCTMNTDCWGGCKNGTCASLG